MPGTKGDAELIQLDKQERTRKNPRTGIEETAPVLDPRWMEEFNFVQYSQPPLTLRLTEDQLTYDLAERGEVEEWKERMTFLEDDLRQLLRFPHASFWCQVIFDESLSVSLDSYLHNAPRNHDTWHFLPHDILELEKRIHKLVFMIFLRLSTHKESKEEFFTPDTYGEIIYENFIFDIPKIMDICSLYGNTDNRPLLIKMMDNVFSRQPKYLDDLSNTVPGICRVFDDVQKKCGTLSVEEYGSKLQQLSESRSRGAEVTIDEITDIILYLTDTSFSLLLLLTVVPTVCHVFHQHDFIIKVAALFENFFPWIEEKLKRSKIMNLHTKLKSAKKNFLLVCQCIIRECVLEPLHRSTSSRSPEDVQPYADEFFHIMLAVLSEKRFLSAYNKIHNIEAEIDITRTAGVYIDEMQVGFVLSALDSACKSFPVTKQRPKKSDAAPQEAQPSTSNDVHPVEFISTSAKSSMQETGAIGGLSDVEAESMCTHVKDLFPDLGEGFIMKCLEHLDFNMEHLINVLLEDNLPPALSKMDRSMARMKKPNSLLDQRFSVFDGDEFDVFSAKRVDTSRIQIGKRHQTKADVKRLLNDKSAVGHLKELVKSKSDRDYDEYDDEYDDTYDTQNVGAQDADSADELDELTLRRPFTRPRVLGGTPPPSDEEEEEEEAEEEDKEARSQVNQPNEQKERPGRGPPRHQNRQASARKGVSGSSSNQDGGGRGPKWKRASQGRGGAGRTEHDQGRGGQKGGTTLAGHDQGGERRGANDRTTMDRLMKDKHKSTRANHNRKAMADKKRSKGMGLLPQS